MSTEYISRISFMLSVPDRARADVAITPEKTYYRFATTETAEDGELPSATKGSAADFDRWAREALRHFSASILAAESIEPVRFTLFVNNVKVEPEVLCQESLKGFVEHMALLADEFAFLRGFV